LSLLFKLSTSALSMLYSPLYIKIHRKNITISKTYTDLGRFMSKLVRNARGGYISRTKIPFFFFWVKI
jgi:hypothetical protein